MFKEYNPIPAFISPNMGGLPKSKPTTGMVNFISPPPTQSAFDGNSRAVITEGDLIPSSTPEN